MYQTKGMTVTTDTISTTPITDAVRDHRGDYVAAVSRLERAMQEVQRLTRNVKCHPDSRNWVAAVRAVAELGLADPF